MTTRIKICGVTHPDHVLAAADAGAHCVGLVFHAASPRTVDRATADRLLSAAEGRVQPVALLVDARPDHPVLAWWHGIVQLHGNEREEDCRAIAASGHTVWRGFSCTPGELARWDAIDAIDALVLDGPRPGSGEPMAMADLAARLPALRHRALLAGGLTPANVAERIRTTRPWGVDVSSGVERERGTKATDLIAAFCRAVQACDRDAPPR